MRRTYADEKRKQDILRAADSDLLALLEAVVEVIKERHRDLEGARIEAEDFGTRLREAMGDRIRSQKYDNGRNGLRRLIGGIRQVGNAFATTAGNPRSP